VYDKGGVGMCCPTPPLHPGRNFYIKLPES
jgi:hypothetical protein